MFWGKKKQSEKLNPELSWTKEMIDYIKEINPLGTSVSTFPIRINIQDNLFSFTQKDHWAFDGIDMEEESNYFGQTRYGDMDYYHEDGTINVDAYSIKETFELLAQVHVKIEFFGKEFLEDVRNKKSIERKFHEALRSEAYKYGYFIFKNQKEDEVLRPIKDIGCKPIAIICLNEEYGIKKKIDDSFVKSKIFNNKSLNIDIDYDSELMKNIKYKQFCTGENYFPIKRICIGGRYELD